MMKKNKEEGVALDPQHSATAALHQTAPHGAKKVKDKDTVSTKGKQFKPQGKDSARDMLYYAHKLPTS